MLTKLLKYELKAAGRQILPLCVVMPAWSAIARLLGLVHVSLPWPQVEQLLGGLLVTGCALVLFGGSCAAVVFLVMRYYRGFYGDEGYFVHLLPASASELLGAKLLAALVWQLCTGISMTLSLAILSAGTGIWEGLWEVLGFVWKNAADLLAPISLTSLIVELLLLIPLSAVSGLLLIYAAISLGQRMRENRILGAIAAYIVLNLAVSAVAGAVNAVVGSILFALSDFSPELSLIVSVGAYVLLAAAECAGAFFFCRWSLAKKLELA